ncbi:MAG: TIGR00153 family protein [Gammaproteobacteria bacterium]|nr:TIGR00153 family protein [Gammaproteobacteria bacterium]
MSYFEKIFGKSPVKPIQTHSDRCYRAARELIKLFEAATGSDWTAARAIREQIVAFENEADTLKHEIRSNLPSGLFMPVARDDLLNITHLQDSIANRARHISGLVVGRHLEIPPSLHDMLMAYVRRNVDAAKKARTTIRQLDELYETGFRGNEAHLVEALIVELDQIENETDDMQIDLRNGLQELEKDLDPIDVMFLYKVIEMVGDVADRAEGVGRRLELLLAR